MRRDSGARRTWLARIRASRRKAATDSVCPALRDAGLSEKLHVLLLKGLVAVLLFLMLDVRIYGGNPRGTDGQPCLAVLPGECAPTVTFVHPARFSAPRPGRDRTNVNAGSRGLRAARTAALTPGYDSRRRSAAPKVETRRGLERCGLQLACIASRPQPTAASLCAPFRSGSISSVIDRQSAHQAIDAAPAPRRHGARPLSTLSLFAEVPSA